MKTITILYVEDDLDISQNTQKPLSYWCDNLIIAHDGVEGFELYQKYRPDIVISDIKMPRLNGIEMVKKIKEIDEDQHIIFTTAHSESSYFIEAIDMQVDGYILKPFDYDLLELKLKKIIKEIQFQEKIYQQNLLIQEVIQLQKDLLMILDDKQKIIFSNEHFLDFFQVAHLDEFYTKHISIEKLFLQTDEFFSISQEKDINWIEQIEALDDNQRIISMMNIQLFTPQAFIVKIRRIEKTQHILITFTEITDIAIEKNILKDKAFNDELTKIYNRAFFNDSLQKQFEEIQSTQSIFSLIMFDIDKFKNFNDTYGHQVGDEVLKELASIVKQHSRHLDIFARWGGEEFIIILPDTQAKNATKVAEHLRKMVESHLFVNDLRVTCSFGVTSYILDDSPTSIVKRVDQALYKSKENGRNQIQLLN